MTNLLRRAVEEVEKLPETEQDEVASWLLAELADEQRWSAAFADSQPALAALAAQALAEHEAGVTK